MWMKAILLVVLILAVQAAQAAEQPTPAAESGYAKVDLKGILKSGVVAIGGETTGLVVRTPDGTFELELGKDKDLREAAKQLDGKSVRVTGRLMVRGGVEVRQRLIVTVATLKPAESADK